LSKMCFNRTAVIYSGTQWEDTVDQYGG